MRSYPNHHFPGTAFMDDLDKVKFPLIAPYSSSRVSSQFVILVFLGVSVSMIWFVSVLITKTTSSVEGGAGLSLFTIAS